MRDWTKTLLPASFKGFPFFVESEESDGSGRRVVLHEYVRGESHDTEDMGKRSQTFSVRAYLASDSVDAESAAFLALLSSPGPGMLVLPKHGAALANCTEARSSSEKNKLGYVSFTLRFTRASAGFASPVLAIGARAAATAAGAIPALLSAGIAGAVTAPPAALARAAESVAAAAEIIALLPTNAPRVAGAEPIDFDLRVIRSAITRAGDQEAISAVVSTIGNFIHDYATIASPAELQAAALAMSVDILGATPSTSSPGIKIEQEFAGSIIGGLSLMLVAEASAAAASRDFRSRDAAATARAAIVGGLDAAMQRSPHVIDAVQSRAIAAVAEAVRHIDESAGSLAPLVQVAVARSVPSTVLAWALYRNPARAQELVAGARTGTSLFMPTTLVAASR